MNHAQRYAMKKEIRAYGERLRLQQVENREREKAQAKAAPAAPARAEDVEGKEQSVTSNLQAKARLINSSPEGAREIDEELRALGKDGDTAGGQV